MYIPQSHRTVNGKNQPWDVMIGWDVTFLHKFQMEMPTRSAQGHCLLSFKWALTASHLGNVCISLLLILIQYISELKENIVIPWNGNLKATIE